MPHTEKQEELYRLALETVQKNGRVRLASNAAMRLNRRDSSETPATISAVIKVLKRK